MVDWPVRGDRKLNLKANGNIQFSIKKTVSHCAKIKQIKNRSTNEIKNISNRWI